MRRALALLLVAVVIAGCTGTGPGGDRTTDSSATATAPQTETPRRSTAPDISHGVVVANRLDRPVNVSITVVRYRTDDRVYDRNTTVHPGERSVYDTVRADPAGDERFEIVATWNGTRADTHLRTTNCYEGAHVVVTESGRLEAYTVRC